MHEDRSPEHRRAQITLWRVLPDSFPGRFVGDDAGKYILDKAYSRN
jgi:hypothetical protein